MDLKATAARLREEVVGIRAERTFREWQEFATWALRHTALMLPISAVPNGGCHWPLVVPPFPGDPDGALVPLPKRKPPERVAPPFPLIAYQALVK